MNKRLEMLEKLTQSGSADSFGWYALAMEYRKEQRPSDALAAFETLRERDPEYLPTYLMAAQVLLDAGRGDDARVWLEQGIRLAQAKGDSKTLGELRDALAQT